jgi:hypothetical protein
MLASNPLTMEQVDKLRQLEKQAKGKNGTDRQTLGRRLRDPLIFRDSNNSKCAGI